MSYYLLRDAIKQNCKFGKFKLTSGYDSDFYVDVKSMMFNSFYLSIMGRLLHKKIESVWGDSVSAVGGIELGSVPLSSAISLNSVRNGSFELNHFVIRKGKRDHGTMCNVEGLPYIEGKNVVLVDDVLTTGGSLLKAHEQVHNVCKVLGAIVVVDRKDTFVTSFPFPVHSIYTRNDIMS